MNLTLTRSKAVTLGCLITALSCLAIRKPSDIELPKCDFDLAASMGRWKMQEQRDLHPGDLAVLQASDYWQRVYQNEETKQAVVATVIAGQAGALASHLPEACYARTDFCSLSDATVWTVPGRDDRFRFQTLVPRNLDQPAVTIAYAWNDGIQWVAPDYPRIRLAGHATLQRLLITMRHPNGRAPDARQAIQQFIELAVNPDEVRQARQRPDSKPVTKPY